MDVKDNRYRKLFIDLEPFQNSQGEFNATSNLAVFEFSLKNDERISDEDKVEEFYQESMEKTIRTSLENVTSIFLTLQNSDINVTSISNADLAWAADNLKKISNLQSKINSCVEIIDRRCFDKHLGENSKAKLECLKYHLHNLSTFVQMIVRKLAEFLAMYQD